MLSNPFDIARALQEVLKAAYEEGEITPSKSGDLTPELLYPFSVTSITGVHTHLKGVGDGVWFRLIDGTVWNEHGEQEVIAEEEDFDTVAN